jgi:endoglucanase
VKFTALMLAYTLMFVMRNVGAQPAAGLLAQSTSPATTSSATRVALAVRVKGNRLVDAQGNVLQFRGVNVSGLEFVHINGAPEPDGWGGQKPDLKAIKAWKANALRIPLNEASYLGYTTYDLPAGGGAVALIRKPDPSGQYKQIVKKLVDDATALGFYIILDLHKNAPNATVPGQATPVPISPRSSAQNEMADADHSPDFWRAVANDYKGYPNVLFDLFNEPIPGNFNLPPGINDVVAAQWTILRDGGVGKIFYGSESTLQQPWKSAGMQSLVDAVRSTGATNVVMVAGVGWAQDTSRWVQFAPKDPLGQLACSWHAYPKYGAAYGTPDYTQPGFGSQTYTWAKNILAAGYPIVIGETGDHSAQGTTNAPFLAVVLPWADQNSVSVVGWTWNAWGADSAVLIKDAGGTPTDGYGKAYRDWLMNHR